MNPANDADEDLGPEIGGRLVPEIDTDQIIPAEAVFDALADEQDDVEPTLDQIRAMAEQDDEPSSEARARELALLGVTRALGHDVTPGHDELHHYWTRGKGLALWTTWTELYDHLVRHVGPLKAKVFASDWFRDRYGYSAGSDLNRVRHGKPPRGHRVGPG
jgi:hypothetical protein